MSIVSVLFNDNFISNCPFCVGIPFDIFLATNENILSIE